MTLKIMTKHIKELENIFQISIETPKLVTVKTRKKFNEILKRKKTKRSVVASALVKRNTIIIFDKNSIETKTTHKKKEYESLIKHELVHFFVETKFGKNIPLWIHEGLATNIAGQKYKKIETSLIDMIKLSSIESFRKQKFAYRKSYWIIKNLIKKRGLEKWLNDLKHQ